MRELQICEINEVSGAGFFSQIAAGFVGGLLGANSAMMKVGIAGGNAGGIVGASVISALFGVVAGGIFGAVQGAVYGFVNDWDKTVEQLNNNMEQWFDMSQSNPK
ncbi:hypothetical protein ACLBW2_00680 [Enterobacteriaceae bacterium C23F]